MRIPGPLTPLLCALTLSATLGAGLLTPAVAHADDLGTLGVVPVADGTGTCAHGAPTVDGVVTEAASAVRTVIPADRLVSYDRQVLDFRRTIAGVRVHRDGLPTDPTQRPGRLGQLDDPIVTYLVNGLDAIRTGRLDHTMSVSRLTVNDVIEVFILANRIVKIPAAILAGLAPTAGFFLGFIVSAAFSGVQWLARRVQDRIRATCLAPDSYQRLNLDGANFPDEHIAVPGPIADLARQLVLAGPKCTPVSELTTSTVVERARDFLAHSDLPIDHAAMNSTAAGMQEFLHDNRIAKAALLRKTDQLGPIVDYLDYGPVTFLANLGFDIYEGKALDTVALSDMTVENAFDLTTIVLDITSLLLGGASLVAGWTGVASTVLTPLGIAKTLAFAPEYYGAPIVRGIMQSMCAV